jgi:hypothetical protein
MGDARWESPAVVIECDDDTHLRTFCALALDIARNIGQPHEQPSARQVSEYLFHWEALLRNQRRLSAEEELGLWGELWVIRSCGLPSLDRAVANWRGPERARVDFVGAGVGVEVKTSLTRLRHTIRHSQAERPLGDLDAYLVSLWVAIDASAGETVPELLETVAANVLDAPSFEAKLSAYGYSHADAATYDRRLTLLEQPLIFRIDGIPRVHGFDEGVTDIRYSVQLDPATALSDGDAQVVWDRIFATH